MAHRKWKEIKQQPSMLPGPAVPGCCSVSFHILWAILSTSTVQAQNLMVKMETFVGLCRLFRNMLTSGENHTHINILFRIVTKQWKKEQVWPFFGCCTSDSQTDEGRHQLYNNNCCCCLLFFPLLDIKWTHPSLFQVQSAIESCVTNGEAGEKQRRGYPDPW